MQPSPPTNLRPTAGDEQVTLSWTAPSDNGGEPITRYEYQSTEDAVAPPPTLSPWTTTGGTQTTVTVYGLDNSDDLLFQGASGERLGL